MSFALLGFGGYGEDKDPESVDAQMDRLMYHERQAR